MVVKIPPPPPIASQDQAFNRWLLEVTSILSDAGGVDVDSIPGLSGLQDQVTQNASDITTTNFNVATLAGQVAGSGQANIALTQRVTTLEASVVNLQTRMNAVEARPQVRYGSGVPSNSFGGVGDWYANVGGAVGSRIYIKTASATWTPFPF